MQLEMICYMMHKIARCRKSQVVCCEESDAGRQGCGSISFGALGVSCDKPLRPRIRVIGKVRLLPLALHRRCARRPKNSNSATANTS